MADRNISMPGDGTIDPRKLMQPSHGFGTTSAQLPETISTTSGQLRSLTIGTPLPSLYSPIASTPPQSALQGPLRSIATFHPPPGTGYDMTTQVGQFDQSIPANFGINDSRGRESQTPLHITQTPSDADLENPYVQAQIHHGASHTMRVGPHNAEARTVLHNNVWPSTNPAGRTQGLYLPFPATPKWQSPQPHQGFDAHSQTSGVMQPRRLEHSPGIPKSSIGSHSTPSPISRSERSASRHPQSPSATHQQHPLTRRSDSKAHLGTRTSRTLEAIENAVAKAPEDGQYRLVRGSSQADATTNREERLHLNPKARSVKPPADRTQRNTYGRYFRPYKCHCGEGASEGGREALVAHIQSKPDCGPSENVKLCPFCPSARKFLPDVRRKHQSKHECNPAEKAAFQEAYDAWSLKYNRRASKSRKIVTTRQDKRI